MRIAVRYFASLREALGSGETLELDGAATVAAVRDALAGRGGRHAEALGRDRAVRSARNQLVCAEAEPVGDGDEIAFFPPVTGG